MNSSRFSTCAWYPDAEMKVKTEEYPDIFLQKEIPAQWQGHFQLCAESDPDGDERDNVDHGFLIWMNLFDSFDSLLKILSPDRHFHLEFRYAGYFTNGADERGCTGKRAPKPGYGIAGQTGIIVPDVPGIHTPQRLLQQRKVRLRDKDFKLEVWEIHNKLLSCSCFFGEPPLAHCLSHSEGSLLWQYP